MVTEAPQRIEMSPPELGRFAYEQMQRVQAALKRNDGYNRAAGEAFFIPRGDDQKLAYIEFRGEDCIYGVDISHSRKFPLDNSQETLDVYRWIQKGIGPKRLTASVLLLSYYDAESRDKIFKSGAASVNEYDFAKPHDNPISTDDPQLIPDKISLVFPELFPSVQI